jgi:hypothetical protein
MTRVRLYGWLIILFASLAILFAGLWDQERRRSSAFQDAWACWRVVHEQGPAYADVTVGVSSHPLAFVQGTVGSRAEQGHLDKVLSEQLGAEQRSRVRFVVRVREESPSTTKAAEPR